MFVAPNSKTRLSRFKTCRLADGYFTFPSLWASSSAQREGFPIASSGKEANSGSGLLFFGGRYWNRFAVLRKRTRKRALSAQRVGRAHNAHPKLEMAIALPNFSKKVHGEFENSIT